jgi:glycolate oxidase iron-sulfur subunit
MSAAGFTALDPCVHCGFCLPACPTYLATGDEADSPRGRIVLMRALERGEIPASDPALAQHLDACLGCRGCEPACPSGVGYGRGLEAAREILARERGVPLGARTVLAVFARRALWKPLFTVARWLRDTGIPRVLAGSGRAGFGLGMLASTADKRETRNEKRGSRSRLEGSRGAVALFEGCVMSTLFRHVNDATVRTLVANGYRVVRVPGQGCCGALHEHAGDRPGAERLARANVTAFSAASTGHIVVNSAGCGALLKDYGHLLDDERASTMAARVRDVSELLAMAGPRAVPGHAGTVAYDAPCHLQHAQQVQAEPITVLQAAGYTVRLLPGSDRCCGSAGIYSMLHPAMARAVLDDKVSHIRGADPRPTLMATGNPGCHMQVGAGLRAAGLDIEVRHPVELLDLAYARSGVYDE